MSNIDIELYTQKSEINTNPPEIVVEICGLATLTSFISLSDTPLYYDNGKFLKAEDNKIVYSDVTWADIKGAIGDNPDLQEQLTEIIKIYAKDYTEEAVNEAINIHDNNVDAHQHIQNIIKENYTDLTEQIENNVNILNNNIQEVQNNVNNNTTSITNINNTIGDIQQNITNINTEIDNINDDVSDIVNNISLIDGRVTTNTKDIADLTQVVEDDFKELNDHITNNSTNITNNTNEINSIKESLKDYSKTSDFADVAFSGDYNDLINLPTIPSIDGLATTKYVDDEIDKALGEISGFDFLVVDTLPEKGESGHIYLVPHQHGDKNIYDEYIWVQSSNDFELIGSTDVDLSNYYTKTETDNLLDKKVDKQDGYTLISETELDRLKNVDNYDDTDIKKDIATKQDKLTAGDNISITTDDTTGVTTISATDTTYTAGDGIEIKDGVITNTKVSAEWGKISGTIGDQKDLQDVFDTKVDKTILDEKLKLKQDVLTAGNGIEIDNNVISGTVITFRDWSISASVSAPLT